MEGLSIAAIVFIVLVVVVLFSALKTVPQGYNWTIERFGRYTHTLMPVSYTHLVIAGKKHYFDPKVIPSIAYTEPEVAWVGKTEKECKQEGLNYEVAKFPWAASGRAIASECAEGMTKLIFDKDTHRILGGAIVGANGGELLGEIGLAIEMGCDAEDIALTIHAHPTLHESVGLAAEVFEGSITDLPNAKAKKK